MVNRTSSAVMGWPSCQTRPVRRWKVQVLPVGSTSQRSARSPTIVSSGPSRTRPRKTRATMARSAAVRAENGLTDVAEPRTPSTYGRAGRTLGAGVETGRDGSNDGATTAPVRTTRTSERMPMTARSRRLTERLGPSSTAAPRSGRRVQQVRRHREEDEQDDQDDRELPEPALDAPPAAIDRGVAADRARQAGAAGLEEDRQGQGGGDDELACGQGRVHGLRPPGMTASLVE